MPRWVGCWQCSVEEKVAAEAEAPVCLLPNPNPREAPYPTLTLTPTISTPTTGPMPLCTLGGGGRPSRGLHVLRGGGDAAHVLRRVWHRGAYHVRIMCVSYYITTYQRISQRIMCITTYHLHLLDHVSDSYHSFITAYHTTSMIHMI